MIRNGLIPLSTLTRTSTGHRLRSDAAASYERMNAAFTRTLGYRLAITDAYRDLAAQIRVKAEKGALAAKPGTSEHGWARALDLASGVPDERSAAHRWMDTHAAEFGWVNPTWASNYDPRDGAHEPWHWEYVPALDTHAGGTLAPRPSQNGSLMALSDAEQDELLATVRQLRNDVAAIPNNVWMTAASGVDPETNQVETHPAIEWLTVIAYRIRDLVTR